MKKVFTKYIADKTIIYLIGLVFALIALISSILYIAIDGGDKSYSTISFVLMLVGSILFIPTIFLKYDILSIIPGLLFAFGFGEALRATLPPLSDVWNGVNFIGGNAFCGLAFTIIFFICMVVQIVVVFNKKYKQSDQ